MRNRVKTANQVDKTTILYPTLHSDGHYRYNIHKIMQIAIITQEKKPADNQD
jgi:hypothetical protein